MKSSTSLPFAGVAAVSGDVDRTNDDAGTLEKSPWRRSMSELHQEELWRESLYCLLVGVGSNGRRDSAW